MKENSNLAYTLIVKLSCDHLNEGPWDYGGLDYEFFLVLFCNDAIMLVAIATMHCMLFITHNIKIIYTKVWTLISDLWRLLFKYPWQTYYY